MTRLRCQTCKLTYRPAAMARDPTLTGGAACRRCGGALRWSSAEANLDPGGVRAVRSVVGPEEQGLNGPTLGPRD